MQVLFTSSGVNFNGQYLAESLDEATMISLVGIPTRCRDIPLNPSGVRRANVTEPGIVWYVDHPENRVHHFFLAMIAEDTPEQPATGFKGSIILNGVEMSPATSEATFPYEGDLHLKGERHVFSGNAGSHLVHFGFNRPRNPLGRRSGAHRLAWVEVSFEQSERGAARMAAYRSRVEIRNAVKGRHR